MPNILWRFYRRRLGLESAEGGGKPDNSDSSPIVFAHRVISGWESPSKSVL